MNYSQPIDKEIVMDMAMTDGDAHYRRYLTDRFIVNEVHEKEDGGLCAHIMDKETGEELKMTSGSPLADGTVEVIEEGVVFHPPRADIEPFVIPSIQEFRPIGNHMASRSRTHMDNVLKQEHMMMPYDTEDDKIIIVLSGEKPM